MSPTTKPRVLFVCTNNSARSQMAEGLLRHLHGDRYEVFSAGTFPTEVHPLAIRAMAERGVDISGHRSKSLDEFRGAEFDLVVTVCDRAREACPFFPGGGKRVHQSFPDPAAAAGTEEERLCAFRDVRDAIEAWIEETLG
ncbi:MAG TPA: arsenate reductase ArsC [Methanothrix sp.]|nr:arsenate reductase ArsC [Methanothrix sp.]HRW83584.1 arsenate reductase ArsC [Methanothrix sp.]